MEDLHGALEQKYASSNGRLRNYTAFKRLDSDNDNFISIQDLIHSVESNKLTAPVEDIYALFSTLDVENKGSIDISQFSRGFRSYQGSFLNRMQTMATGAYYEGGPVLTGTGILSQ